MIEKKTCKRCGYSWFPRKEERPKLCAKCRTPRWDEPKGQNEPGAKRKYNISVPKMGRGLDGRFKRVNS